MEKKYGIEVKCIPDIRVTSGDYGEHTGISASEYQKLTGEKLKLHNHEIYVVYQRNKAEYGTLGIRCGLCPVINLHEIIRLLAPQTEL